MYNARHLCNYDVIDLIANWKLGQDKTKLNSHRISRLDKTAKAENVQFRNFLSPTVLTCFEFISHRKRGQHKTRQDSLVLSARLRCEIGISVGIAVTKLEID